MTDTKTREFQGQVLALREALIKCYNLRPDYAKDLSFVVRVIDDTAQAAREAEARIWNKVANHTERASERVRRNHIDKARAGIYVRALAVAVKSMRNEAGRLRNGGSEDE